MELVASARLRRSQQRIEAMRPYADRMLELMAGVSKAAGAVRLPLLERREQIQKVAIVPVTADRGLAGGFNAQVIRRSLALMREQQAEGREVVWFSTGRKAASTLRFRRMTVAQSWIGFSERPGVRRRADDRARRVRGVRERRRRHCLRRLQRVRLGADAEGDRARAAADPDRPARGQRGRRGDEERQEIGNPDFIYEPEPAEILARLLPVYVETELYRALLESAASEQGARMTAMRNASKAAGELIDSLTLAMNRARQAEITQEILEVVAGADALAG